MRGASKARAKPRDLRVETQTGTRAVAVNGGCQNNLQPAASQGDARATPAMTRHISIIQDF